MLDPEAPHFVCRPLIFEIAVIRCLYIRYVYLVDIKDRTKDQSSFGVEVSVNNLLLNAILLFIRTSVADIHRQETVEVATLVPVAAQRESLPSFSSNERRSM